MNDPHDEMLGGYESSDEGRKQSFKHDRLVTVTIFLGLWLIVIGLVVVALVAITR